MIFGAIEVVKTTQNFHYIEWDMDLSYPSNSYDFAIYWSNNPNSSFVEITDGAGVPVRIDGAIGPLVFTHNRTHYDFNQEFYYRIKAIQKANPAISYDSISIPVSTHSDGIHETIRYNEDVLYRHYSGEKCKVYKRRTHGQRCPECWNEFRRQSTKSHCNTCNNTGFVNGFYTPIVAQISTDSDPKKNEITQTGENMTSVMRARMSNYPILRDKDMIVLTSNNKRYKVIHVDTTKLPALSQNSKKLSNYNYVLSQLITMEEIVSSDQEFAIT